MVSSIGVGLGRNQLISGLGMQLEEDPHVDVELCVKLLEMWYVILGIHLLIN